VTGGEQKELVMQIYTQAELAATYRQNGWCSIADILELEEESPFQIDMTLVLETTDTENCIYISDIFDFFTSLQRTTHQRGQKADAVLHKVNQACWEVVQMLLRPELRNVN
jgi:hypothetical protein